MIKNDNDFELKIDNKRIIKRIIIYIFSKKKILLNLQAFIVRNHKKFHFVLSNHKFLINHDIFLFK